MLNRILTAVGISLVSVSAMATAPAFPDVASGVDFAAVGTQAGTIALAVAAVYVIFKGGKLLLAFLRSS